MSRKNLILLRGGFGEEQNLSKRFGKFVKEKISDKHKLTDVNVDGRGYWYSDGLRVLPASKRIHNDGILPCLFSIPYNFLDELEALHMPIIGFNPYSYRKAQDKVLAKRIMKDNGLKIPYYQQISKPTNIDETILSIFRTTPLPTVIKPTFAGSSIDTIYVDSFPVLEKTIEDIFNKHDEILVEQFITGKEASVFVINDFRGQDYYVFTPAELNKKNKICTFEDKCSNHGFKLPSSFSADERSLLQEMAITAHRSIGQRGISKVDFIVNPQKGIYFLEINPMPLFDDLSGVVEIFNTTGTSIDGVLDHLIDLAFE